MQVSEFTNGGFVAHKVYLAGMKSKFSIWVNQYGILTDAERYDNRGRAYPVKRDSYSWGRLDGRAQIIAGDMARLKAALIRRKSGESAE